MAPTTSLIVAPARSTRALPWATRSTLALMSVLISRAASALRPAKLRTSLATTAKPRPCSPARAASTAALSAMMLVWNAMESITPMMSEIFCDEALMPCMVSTTCATTSPPCTATVLALVASWLACWALSAFWRTVALSCSMDAAVSSSALAWLSVRADRSVLPWAICTLAVATLSDPLRTLRTTCVSCVRICCKASSNWPTSLVPWAMGAPLTAGCAAALPRAPAAPGRGWPSTGC